MVKNTTLFRAVALLLLAIMFSLAFAGCESGGNKLEYSVVVAEGEGFNVILDGSSTVKEGGSFSFSIVLHSGYENSMPVVKAGSVTLEKNAQGKYVLENIRADAIIRITGITLASGEFEVTFDTRGGQAIAPVTVSGGAVFRFPPAKKAGVAFSHWCRDAGLTDRFNVGDRVLSDLTLYAAYAGIDNVVMQDTPVIIINTNNAQPITSKEDYLPSEVTVTNAAEEYCFTDKIAGVRGRGNYTWTLDKKGYRVKFDKRTSMFGEEAAKNWTLIPNYTDKSNMRNFLALNFANRLDNLMWNSSARFVELYLNGEYMGLYLLCEQNQVDKTRVDIEEGSTDIDTGYFVERDRYAFADDTMIEGVDYFNTSPPETYIIEGDPAAYCYVLKSPASDDSNYTPQHFNYIKDYIISAENAIISRNYAQFTALCDEATFIDYFMVDQVFTNWEANRLSSFYMYKEKGGKLSLGPVWDFDLAVGFSPGQPRNAFVTENYWFMCLMDMPQFKANFKARYAQLSSQIAQIFDDIAYVQENHYLAINHNYEKWDVTEVIHPENHPYGGTPMQYFTTYKEHAAFVETFLRDRVQFLNANIKHW